MKKILMI